MRAGRCILNLVLCLGTAAAAAQTQQVTIEAGDSIPLTTVVPVQQTPVRITERTTVYDESERGMNRAERRAYKARLFAQRIDSLIQSRNYMFFPNSMQGLPGGMIRNIYDEYFFFGLFVDHAEVHLPTERSFTQHLGMLNFDSMNIRNYQASHLQWGWNVTMNVFDGDVCYTADLEISTITGEAVLTLLTPTVTMRYVGALWNGRWAGGPPRR